MAQNKKSRVPGIKIRDLEKIASWSQLCFLISQVRLKRVRVVIVERVKLCDSRSGIGWRGDRSFNGAIFRLLVCSHGLNRVCHKSAKKSPFSESPPISKRKQPINLKKLPFPDYVKLLWTLFFTFRQSFNMLIFTFLTTLDMGTNVPPIFKIALRKLFQIDSERFRSRDWKS